MIAVALVSGLAGFWVWMVLQDEDGLFKAVGRLADKWQVTAKWLHCPWCSGAWFSGLLSIAVFHPSDARVGVAALAAAAVTGILGSYFQGE